MALPAPLRAIHCAENSLVGVFTQPQPLADLVFCSMLTAALGLIRRLGKSSSKSFEEELGSADGAVLFRSIYAAALRDSPAAALLCARHRRRRQHDPALIPVVFVLDRKPLPSTPFESCPG